MNYHGEHGDTGIFKPQRVQKKKFCVLAERGRLARDHKGLWKYGFRGQDGHAPLKRKIKKTCGNDYNRINPGLFLMSPMPNR